MSGTRQALAARCRLIEEAYEFCLAYAAQGLSGTEGSGAGGQAREWLGRLAGALVDLGEGYGALVETEGLEPASRYRAFVALLDRDARAAHALVDLVLAQPVISSQLVDNLNASIHVRTLLTDLFVIDEILATSTPGHPVAGNAAGGATAGAAGGEAADAEAAGRP
ncbi:MAG: hypothetical protein AB7G23_01330 [Vicinamibacterales bacterium]